MGTITSMREFRRVQSVQGIPSYDNNLSTLLREIEDLRGQFTVRDKSGLVILKGAQLKEYFFSGIYSECRKHGWLSPSFYHSAGYAADVCTNAVSTTPQFWTAFEYFIKAWMEGNRQPDFLQHGGDACFLISAIFPGQAERRGLKISFYEDMGASLYSHWCVESKREIGGIMSNCFHQIAVATTECFQKLRYEQG